MKRFGKLLLFLCCRISLLSSVPLFYNQITIMHALNAVFPQIYGGSGWFVLQLFRMLLLLVATTLSFINLLLHKKSTV